MAEYKVEFTKSQDFRQARLLKNGQVIATFGALDKVIAAELGQPDAVEGVYEKYLMEQLKADFLKDILGHRVKWTRAGRVFIETSLAEDVAVSVANFVLSFQNKNDN